MHCAALKLLGVPPLTSRFRTYMAGASRCVDFYRLYTSTLSALWTDWKASAQRPTLCVVRR